MNGSFGVTNKHGVLVANVHPGRVVSFAMQAPGANQSAFSGVGLVSYENGTYYLTTDEDVKYILTCKDSHRFVNDKVVVTGTISGALGQTGPGVQQSLCVKTMDINGETGMSTGQKWLIAGLIIAGGTGLAVALALRNSSPPPVSR